MPLSNEHRRIAEAMNRDLAEAIACYGFFLLTGRDRALITKVNNGRVHPGYNVISESLHRSTILALCRLWDKSGDSVHIPKFVRVLAGSSISVAAKVEIAKLKKQIGSVEQSDELEALERSPDQLGHETTSPCVSCGCRRHRQKRSRESRRTLRGAKSCMI